MTRDEELYARMLNGELYKPEGAKFHEIHDRAMAYQDEFNSLPSADWDAHYRVLTRWLGEVGEGVIVRAPLHVDYGIHTSIGARTFVNYDCIFLDVAPITIGENCQIAPRVQLLTAWHPLEPTLRSEGWEGGSPIVVGNNVWLGAGVMVLPGVRIGDNSIIGAGSVVTKDIPANTIAVGSPARVVKELPSDASARDVIPPHLLGE
ncbi:sugar O-acetyltransferase [Arcanobacterium phocisimile]|uniref:Sugar O-acetyltransferase n=1 Tax=Arcanobacterium phocisimile TaxID=1302235 RepID=A0ABX7IIQ9_9ACTO|nr:sugar O-acetyltransferase [Arcanobacterium phocisimile]QRV01733.1 sugar O-acetyltransferase [Arcanobacterium phocisimile]